MAGLTVVVTVTPTQVLRRTRDLLRRVFGYECLEVSGSRFFLVPMRPKLARRPGEGEEELAKREELLYQQKLELLNRFLPVPTPLPPTPPPQLFSCCWKWQLRPIFGALLTFEHARCVPGTRSRCPRPCARVISLVLRYSWAGKLPVMGC